MKKRQIKFHFQIFNFKKKNKKAQVAMEFLLVIGIILLLAIIILYDTINKRDQIQNVKEILLKKELCLGVSSFISEVYVKGTGTEAYLILAGDKLSYSLTIQPGARNLFVGDTESIYCTIPISSVSNSTQEVDWFRFEFSADNRTLKFENIGNFVVVSLNSSFDDDDDYYEELEIPT